MFTAPKFQIENDVIHIANCHGRGHTIVLIVIALFLTIVPFFRSYFPKDSYFAFENGIGGMGIWIFGIWASLSAAFWWSTVEMNPKTDTILIRRRWGLFVSTIRKSISSFHAITVNGDGDGDRACIYMVQRSGNHGFEANYSKAIVWGRSRDETKEIAHRISKHLQLELKTEYPV